MQIETYRDEYKDDIISLILAIQNGEAKIGLTLDEQPDLKDITQCYIRSGGGFWVMTENGRVIGTIGLMIKGNGCGVLKKFFVEKAFRCRGVGRELYETLLGYAKEKGLTSIILDTPSVAKASHRFYEREGFVRITSSELPVEYSYPDRNSFLYMLRL